MNANDLVNKLIEADLDDPAQNLDRHVDALYKERRFGGKLLAFQPESADPLVSVYFDALEPWGEFDPRTIKQLNRLAAEWSKLPKLDSERLRRVVAVYPNSGHAQTYSLMADVFVDAGYSVWLSDTVFEVYRPEDITEEENTNEAEEDRLNDIP